MDPVAHLLVIAACLAFSAFFSGSETAFVRLRKDQVEREARGSRAPAAMAVAGLHRSMSRLLVTILLGNNVVNILGASVASAMAIHYLGEEVGIALSTVLMTVTVLVFCEVLPKALAARSPARIAHGVALPLYLFHQVLRPVHIAFDRFVEPMVHAISRGADIDNAAPSPEEVLELARRARSAHSPGSALAIIGAAAAASERTVAEIMVPRTEIIAFPVSESPSTMIDRLLEEGATRAPVYRDSIDTLLGVVHLKDLVRMVRQGEEDVTTILHPLPQVPERKLILSLLSEMQRAFVHLAVVKDEFGVTQGLVTQEDILEELVGEIRDEFDRGELEAIRRRPDGAWEALGRTKVLDFNRETGLAVPAEPGDTLSGIVFNGLGHTPRLGETVHVGAYTIAVASLSGSRVTRVRVVGPPAPPAAQEAAEGS